MVPIYSINMQLVKWTLAIDTMVLPDHTAATMADFFFFS